MVVVRLMIDSLEMRAGTALSPRDVPLDLC